MTDIEIVSHEYVHETVKHFVDDFINRRIFLRDIDTFKGDMVTMIDAYSKFISLVKDYFDITKFGTERQKLEKEIFDWIVLCTTSNIIIHNKSSNSNDLSKRIGKLEEKLDSNNKLLISISKILMEIVEKFDIK